MSVPLRVVALEEHIVTADVLAAWERLDPSCQDLSLAPSRSGSTGRALLDTGQERLAAMDAQGVDVQVLSLSTPGLQNLASADAVVLQREVNDHLAAVVTLRPDRFDAWATLATPDPVAAAAELERAVGSLGLAGAMIFGRTRDRHLDHPSFRPMLEVAEELRVPLYLHPQSPPVAVRRASYEGLGEDIGAALATHGIGWHYETGLQLLRLVLAGVFDRFPHLRIVTGHWGELLLFFLDRVDNLAGVAHLPRKPSEYLREHLWVTPSGILSSRYLQWTRDVLGIERVLFATDYPFVPLAPNATASFLTELEENDYARVAWRNWHDLRAEIRR